MNCPEFEILLCDYLDGTLDPAGRQAVEEHMRSCAGCAEFVRDVTGAVAFMERTAVVEPPPELLTRISFHIPNSQESGSVRISGFGVGRFVTRWLQSVMQPRFAMGMAMTILSFSMLGRFAGIEVRQLRPSDLSPAKVWAAVDDRVHRSWQRAVKYYDSLRLVYEVQSRLKEWTEEQEQEKKAGGAQAPASK